MMWEEKVTEIKEHDDLLTRISASFDTRVVFAQRNREHICHRMALSKPNHGGYTLRHVVG